MERPAVKELTPLIQVFNMPRSLAFYRDVLGFEIVNNSGNGDNSSWVWLRLGGIDLMLNDQYEPGHVPDSPPPARTEWHGDTCLYFGCLDPDAMYEYLREKGVRARSHEDSPIWNETTLHARPGWLRDLLSVSARVRRDL